MRRGGDGAWDDPLGGCGLSVRAAAGINTARNVTSFVKMFVISHPPLGEVEDWPGGDPGDHGQSAQTE